MSSFEVGIIGFGYVGSAVYEYFKRKNIPVKVYDKFKETGNSFEEVIDSKVVFICVPTPMVKQTGECSTKIVENVLSECYDKINDFDATVFCVKSTVRPGFTEKMKNSFPGLRITFSPEFLTEATPVDDFINADRIIVGGTDDDCEDVLSAFSDHDTAMLLYTDSTTAEIVKLFTNAFLATKVTFANEMYLVCDKLGINYDDVRTLASIDKRISSGHLKVPGPDGDFGYGGHCFVKDFSNLRELSYSLRTGEQLFSAVIDRNNELRKDRDWERMEGRAVIDEYEEV